MSAQRERDAASVPCRARAPLNHLPLVRASVSRTLALQATHWPFRRARVRGDRDLVPAREREHPFVTVARRLLDAQHSFSRHRPSQERCYCRARRVPRFRVVVKVNVHSHSRIKERTIDAPVLAGLKIHEHPAVLFGYFNDCVVVFSFLVFAMLSTQHKPSDMARWGLACLGIYTTVSINAPAKDRLRFARPDSY